MQHVDIDGSWTRSNVVEDLEGVKSPAICQAHCTQRVRDGCNYWVFEQATGECVLYTDMEHIEYDDDEDELKVMGLARGCVPCHRTGWDYVKTGSGHNLVGKRAIHGVTKTLSCAQICDLVPECRYWSFHNDDETCELKNGEARNGIVTDYDYISGAKGCVTKNCMLQHKNFEDSYWSSYSLIGNNYLELIPGVSNPGKCQAICELTSACSHWTVDLDDQGCYLVDSPEALEYDDDKISGPKLCVPERK